MESKDLGEATKVEKESFEISYHEYADDVLNAESYCLTSNDFKKAIDFFEKCGDYKDAPDLLKLAKMRFVAKISSLSDCLKAIEYIEEFDDISAEEKESKKQAVIDLGISFAVIELDSRGYVAILPEERSAENILCVMQKIAEAKNKEVDGLNALEKELIPRCLREAAEYIEENTALAVKSCTDIDVLCEMRELIPVVKSNFDEVQLCDIESLIDKKHEELNEKNRIIEQQQLKEKARQKNKEITKKLGIIAVILGIVLAIVAVMVHKANGYSAKNVEIAVVSKSNVEFNEDLADGHIGAGYFYLFEFKITNNSRNDIELVRGNLEIVNKEGRILSSSPLEMHCDIEGKAENTCNVKLNISKGNAARELWNSELSDLIIKFNIKTIYFKDGTNKNYSNPKKITVYPY